MFSQRHEMWKYSRLRKVCGGRARVASHLSCGSDDRHLDGLFRMCSYVNAASEYIACHSPSCTRSERSNFSFLRPLVHECTNVTHYTCARDSTYLCSELRSRPVPKQPGLLLHIQSEPHRDSLDNVTHQR